MNAELEKINKDLQAALAKTLLDFQRNYCSGVNAAAAAGALPAAPATDGCCTAVPQVIPATIQPTGSAAGANSLGGACCSSCAAGGPCSGSGACAHKHDSPTGAACLGQDRVHPAGQLPARDDTGMPIPNVSCQVPPGYVNCEPNNGELAPCDIERVVNTRRRWTVSAGTSAGTLVNVISNAFLDYVDTPAGYSWYRFWIEPVGVAHDSCVKEVVVTYTPDGGNPTAQVVDGIAMQSEFLYADGDGGYLKALNWPRPALYEDITVTDGRCQCECLCVCATARYRVAVDLLLPTLNAGDTYDVVARGTRDNWQRACGPCPPEAICGRETT